MEGQAVPAGWPASSYSSVCLSSSVIVTEKTNILLRYLHQQWDKKVRQAGCGQGPREGAQCPAGGCELGNTGGWETEGSGGALRAK